MCHCGSGPQENNPETKLAERKGILLEAKLAEREGPPEKKNGGWQGCQVESAGSDSKGGLNDQANKSPVTLFPAQDQFANGPVMLPTAKIRRSRRRRTLRLVWILPSTLFHAKTLASFARNLLERTDAGTKCSKVPHLHQNGRKLCWRRRRAAAEERFVVPTKKKIWRGRDEWTNVDADDPKSGRV